MSALAVLLLIGGAWGVVIWGVCRIRSNGKDSGGRFGLEGDIGNTDNDWKRPPAP